MMNSPIFPLYEQVRRHLISEIDEGNLRPGDKLPSEKELEHQFQVSRVTVRRALQELSHEERIVRVPGKGSFVLQPKIEPLTALTSFSENMRAQGFEPSYRQAQIEIIHAEKKVADLLNLNVGGQIVHIHRIMLANGLPMAIQSAYLPYSVYEKGPGLFTPEVLTNISMYKVMEIELGVKLYKAEEWVDAFKASAEEAELLEIAAGDSILIIERLTYSIENIPVEYVTLIFPANRYRYKVELYRPS